MAHIVDERTTADISAYSWPGAVPHPAHSAVPRTYTHRKHAFTQHTEYYTLLHTPTAYKVIHKAHTGKYIIHYVHSMHALNSAHMHP